MDENRSSYLGELRVLGEDAEKDLLVQIEIVRSGPNRNGWDFANMAKLAGTFSGTPLLCAYLPNQIGDGHNFREKVLPTGEEILDFTGPTAERIVGMISEDPADIWTEEREDGVWAVARGKIWRFYNRQLADRLALQGGMAVSAEIETYEGHLDENGVEVFTDWVGMGVTLLHESVPPAVPGANIQAIRAMSETFREMKLKAASLRSVPACENDAAEGPGEMASAEHDSNRRGVKATMFNRREAERLAPAFPGYRIVGLSEDSRKVILMSETGGLFSYASEEDIGTEIITSRIAPVKTVTVTCLADGEGDGVGADLDEMLRHLSETAAESGETIRNLNAQLERVTGELEAMREAEHQRRLEAVRDAVKRTLAEIGEACDNEAEACDSEAEAITAAAEDYAGMCDGDGKFCGADRARSALMAAFAEKHMKAEREKSRRAFAWDGQSTRSESRDDGGIAGLLASING